MSYTSNVVDFPSAVSGMFPCKEKHAQYKVDKSAHDTLVRELSADAATCSGLHTDYDASVAANAAALAQLAQCQAAHTAHATVTGDFNSRNAEIAACAAANTAVKTKMATNARKRATYDSAYRLATQTNTGRNAANSRLRSRYNAALATWTTKNAAYQIYLLQVGGQARGVSMAWARKLSSTPSLRNYQFNHMQPRCGTHMRCQNNYWHTSRQQMCNPVRGLGATNPVATTCQVWASYPYCPSSCPVHKPNPGARPSEPSYYQMTTLPTPPTYLSTGSTTKCPKLAPKPGTAPACDTGMTIPVLLPEPTCAPPEIPPAPIAPTCKISMFSQIGPIWLVLAAGAGGVYWYSKKK